jgi:hypothetical protein
MARRVFFSFHYGDIMNANIVRMSGEFKPTKETGFYDKSLWEDAETKGKSALQKLIDDGLRNTSVTCFLLGAKTSTRPWCKYELEKSIADKKGILGILLPNQTEHGPKWIINHGTVYKWDHDKFPDWVARPRQRLRVGWPRTPWRPRSCPAALSGRSRSRKSNA